MEAAFCSADRVTLAGSMMPVLNMSTSPLGTCVRVVEVGVGVRT
jgi:hypothetical protein